MFYSCWGSARQGSRLVSPRLAPPRLAFDPSKIKTEAPRQHTGHDGTAWTRIKWPRPRVSDPRAMIRAVRSGGISDFPAYVNIRRRYRRAAPYFRNPDKPREIFDDFEIKRAGKLAFSCVRSRAPFLLLSDRSNGSLNWQDTGLPFF